MLHLPFTLPVNSPLPDAYDIVACEACGFVYADTTGSQCDYDRYYYEHSKYEDPIVATGGSQNPYDHARIEAQADRIAAQIGKDARILDIGCASGGLLLALRVRGYQYLHGVDGARACIEQLSSQGIPATLSRLSELHQSDLQEGSFDLIVLSHVLEHVVDLKQLLTTARSMLAENGKIYVETPDASRYDPISFVPYYFFDSEHINHFNTRSLGILAQTVGLYPIANGQTTLEVAEAMHYPACWVWLSLDEETICMVMERVEEVPLHARIRKYIADSSARESYPILATLEKSQAPVIVWGAGSFAQRLFRRTALGRCNIIGIADKDINKRGQSFAGHIVSSPETLLKSHPDITLLVAAAVQFDAIVEEAQNLSSTGNIIRLDSSTVFVESDENIYHLGGLNFD